MTEPDLAWSFPISGSWVSTVLAARFPPGAAWLITFFDIPSGDPPHPALNDIRSRMKEGNLVVTTGVLCEALQGAPQVWILDMCLTTDSAVRLYIEDGHVFELDLPEKRA